MVEATFAVRTFTGPGLAGGPTAVCVLAAEPAAADMLRIARGTSVPVTAFLFPRTDPRAGPAIRYSTPVTAIDACGHATLAAAEVAFGMVRAESLVFAAPDGPLPVARYADGRIGMRYPRYATAACPAPAAVLAALGIARGAAACHCPTLLTMFLVVDPPVLRAVRPDFAQLAASSDTLKEVVLTAAGDTADHDYLFRSFCPWIGIDEDLATGSVHGVLAHARASRTGRPSLLALQVSREGAAMSVTALPDATLVAGRCVRDDAAPRR